MFPIEKYHYASSVADAIQALAGDEKARVLAGGTDVLVRLHGGNSDYDHIVDINGLSELKAISRDDSGNISIGSRATCTELMEHPLIKEHLPMLVQSLGTIGGPQVRNCATMGGNICNGAVSADSACAALVYEFDMLIEGVKGERLVSINGFHTGPGQTILENGDLFKGFVLRPEMYHGLSASYEKYAMRGAMDIATIGCGVGLRMDGEHIETIKIAFTVAAPTPIRCRNAEQAMVGRIPDDESLLAMTEALLTDVTPRTSWRAEKEFRLHLIKTLAKRGIRMALTQTGRIC
jgi:xanthine dehydrogenase FAD-binding subunit